MVHLDTQALLRAIDEELNRLRQVRDLLAGAPAAFPAKSKRKLSDEARQRIVDAQKRRWAAQKAGA